MAVPSFLGKQSGRYGFVRLRRRRPVSTSPPRFSLNLSHRDRAGDAISEPNDPGEWRPTGTELLYPRIVYTALNGLLCKILA